MIHAIHKLIVWYLRRRCGGVFHCYNYGPSGRYVVLMTDDFYARWNRVRGHKWDDLKSAIDRRKKRKHEYDCYKANVTPNFQARQRVEFELLAEIRVSDSDVFRAADDLVQHLQ